MRECVVYELQCRFAPFGCLAMGPPGIPDPTVSAPADSPVVSPMSPVGSAASSDALPLEPRRVWIFFDRALFALASELSGCELESAWSRFWQLAEGRGHVFEPSPQFDDCRAALELEVLRMHCGTRSWAPGESISVSEFARGPELSASGAGPSSLRQPGPSRSLWLFLDFEIFRRGTALCGRDLQSAWSRFWCLAEARGVVSGDDARPTIAVEVPL